jgi:DnaJ-class molecular chaperone
MAASTDPTRRPGTSIEAPQTRADAICGWCMGSGQYLEALDCDVEHVYIPVICAGCEGSGKASHPA